MKRLTTDNPTDMTENLLNLAYAQDGWVHIRGMRDKFLKYIKYRCQMHDCGLIDASDLTENEICETICECGADYPECPVFLLYSVATQAAELRARLKQYEDAEEQGELVQLPCKIGDSVFTFVPENCSSGHCKDVDTKNCQYSAFKLPGIEVFDCRCKHAYVEKVEIEIIDIQVTADKREIHINGYVDITPENIYKTCEEAEKALEVQNAKTD